MVLRSRESKMNEERQTSYKRVAKLLAFLVGVMLLCRATNDAALPVVVIVGLWCTVSRRIGWALVFFALFPFLVVVNPGILPKETPVARYALRFGPLLIGLALALLAVNRRGRDRLPFGSLVPFLLLAFISSMQGWAPYVSYLKLVNFGVFLVGIWIGTQNLQGSYRQLEFVRSFFLALSVLIVFGSITLIPFPSISYLTSLRHVMAEYGAEYAESVFREMQLSGEKTLFTGILNHSQALAPILACVFGWVLCDMLFVERRFARVHLALLVCSLPLFYMTRSRVAFLSLASVLFIVYFYTTRKVRCPEDVRRKLRQGLAGFLALIAVVAVVAQLRTGAMMEWLRKTNDVAGDTRTLVDAVTASRESLIEMSMYEFRRNPLWGSGFQVAEYTRDQVRNQGIVLSASIEKGILPVMVLGETGILGSCAFLFFLFSFYRQCARKGYFVTVSLFSVYLVTNIGEATFFSPGGVAGIEWMICVVGGFTLDMRLKAISSEGRVPVRRWQNN